MNGSSVPMGSSTPPMMTPPPSSMMMPPPALAGRGGGTPARPVTQCTPQVPLTPECAACSCTARDDCGSLISRCDADCWGLFRCMYRNNCQGDSACIFTYCPEYSASYGLASSVGPCVTRCAMPCSWDLQVQPGIDTDAGI